MKVPVGYVEAYIPLQLRHAFPTFINLELHHTTTVTVTLRHAFPTFINLDLNHTTK
jgi:hypothetical protein